LKQEIIMSAMNAINNNTTGSTASRLNLSRDSTLFYGRRGTAIVTMQGHILIMEADNHLVDIALSNCTLITEGECHVLQRDGWLRLQASGAGRAAGLVIAPPGNWLLSLWQRWLRRARAQQPLRP
jgi:hypothetical protein